MIKLLILVNASENLRETEVEIAFHINMAWALMSEWSANMRSDDILDYEKIPLQHAIG